MRNKKDWKWIASWPRLELQCIRDVYHYHIHALIVKLYKNKNLRCSFKAGLHNSENSNVEIDPHKFAAGRKSLFPGSSEEILKRQWIIRSRTFATFSAIEKAALDRMLCRPDLKLWLMLQSRAKYTVFIACQSYQTNFCDGLEMKLTPPLDGIQQAGATETAAKSVTPCFTSG